ncbi:copper chaperone PCu(A)C [Silvimonas iriomotensis]|uniref:Copper chaperone PCu(A)C n=1 Tax=Silvimonas iriomotensis TaxID=449662 RepID=A0ABQ2P6P5_9NEIS|nr:copper chaperone PCu(A)C [Silvimonas iriomotensis]GGP19177.1 hypothetical protein GCM10010970_09320 [Silvimonas iriomotensis]
MLKKTWFIALPLALTLAAPCFAADTLTVSQAWARATPPGASTAAAYFIIKNEGATTDSIVGARTSVADDASVHEMKMANGMMQMRAVPKLDIPAKASVTFSPQGYHVMLTGLKAPLKEGSHFKLSLALQRGGSIDVNVDVLGLGATEFSHSH